MPPESDRFTALNLPVEAIPEWMGSFSLSAPPNTDLWRKPPAGDTSTAPVLYTSLQEPFVAAEVTVSGDFELEWDQAGLVIFAGRPPGRRSTSTIQQPTPVTNRSGLTTSTTTTGAAQDNVLPPYTPAATSCSKWVKVALEFTNNALHASSVCATTDGADWSVSSLPQAISQCAELRLKMERIGYALWIWYEAEANCWKKLREVTWFFWGVDDKAVRVGVYASRPASFGPTNWERRNRIIPPQRKLFVRFEGLEIF